MSILTSDGYEAHGSVGLPLSSETEAHTATKYLETLHIPSIQTGELIQAGRIEVSSSSFAVPDLTITSASGEPTTNLQTPVTTTVAKRCVNRLRSFSLSNSKRPCNELPSGLSLPVCFELTRRVDKYMTSQQISCPVGSGQFSQAATEQVGIGQSSQATGQFSQAATEQVHLYTPFQFSTSPPPLLSNNTVQEQGQEHVPGHVPQPGSSTPLPRATGSVAAVLDTFNHVLCFEINLNTIFSLVEQTFSQSQ